jgi:5-methylcytosine-specific restriction endonuclease McrA
VSTLRHRPIIGGIFGAGRYALASTPCVVRGLHAVRYFVIEPASGAVLSLADDKTEALDAARAMLAANDSCAAPAAHQAELWPDEHPRVRPVVDRWRPVSKRRRDVFSKCRGRCHYCGGALALDGIWHVEHMLPRALGGLDAASNLVAACAPCNLEKRDRTALEFVTARKPRDCNE